MEKIKIRMMEEKPKDNFLETAPYVLLVALVFLLPIFFIPSSVISFGYGKIILLSVLTLLSLFSWIILAFKEGKLILPWNWLSLSAIVIPVTFFLAALLSPTRSFSLIGEGYELGTASFILLAILLMFLISVFVRSKERIFYFYLWFIGGFLVLALYQILHLFFGPNFLSFQYFTSVSSNPLGSWNDIAVFSGIAVLLSLMSLELLVLNRMFKWLFYVVLAFGLFLLAVANFTVVWNTPITIVTLIGFFALIFFVYFLSANRAQEFQSTKENISTPSENSTQSSFSRRLPLPSLIVLVFAIIFTLPPLIPYLNTTYLDNHFNVNALSVAPTWQSTFLVAKDALKHDAAFGVGPNRFNSQWILSKPISVNSTDFWNTDFSYGVGIIPTFIVTTGILGILSWIVFLILMIYLGIRAIFSRLKDPFSLYLIISSFFLSLYLWLMHILYVPGIATFLAAFIFTGLFLASLFREGILRERVISYVQDSRKGFAVILLLVLLMIGIISWGYFLSSKVLAAAYANQSSAAFNNTNTDQAESYIVKAINTDKESEYYRFLSQIELSRMSSLLQGSNGNSDVIKTQFQSVLDNALSAASLSTNLNPTDYQNWISLGTVYETVVPLGVANASTSAESAYKEALKRNPNNPGIYFILARLSVANKNLDKAREYLIEALKLKNNYLAAIYALAQLDLAAGNSQAALSDLAAAVSVAPNNADPYFQLGSLEYSLGNYTDAVSAFNRAVLLVPNYADAKYYLGLSLYQTGDINGALQQFQDLYSANPNNAVLSSIINNLKAGRSPLSATSAATSSAAKK